MNVSFSARLPYCFKIYSFFPLINKSGVKILNIPNKPSSLSTDTYLRENNYLREIQYTKQYDMWTVRLTKTLRNTDKLYHYKCKRQIIQVQILGEFKSITELLWSILDQITDMYQAYKATGSKITEDIIKWFCYTNLGTTES